jgi:hypothetical protein
LAGKRRYINTLQGGFMVMKTSAKPKLIPAARRKGPAAIIGKHL